jgi:hypothetical protein
MSSRSPVILLIGSDAALAYLIERYAERSGCEVRVHPIVPAPSTGSGPKPVAVLFSSIENLEAAQAQITPWTSAEIPLLVCSSVNDQSRARELGADQCLVHPLTYEGFLAAFTAAHIFHPLR